MNFYRDNLIGKGVYSESLTPVFVIAGGHDLAHDRSTRHRETSGNKETLAWINAEKSAKQKTDDRQQHGYRQRCMEWGAPYLRKKTVCLFAIFSFHTSGYLRELSSAHAMPRSSYWRVWGMWHPPDIFKKLESSANFWKYLEYWSFKDNASPIHVYWCSKRTIVKELLCKEALLQILTLYLFKFLDQ